MVYLDEEKQTPDDTKLARVGDMRESLVGALRLIVMQTAAMEMVASWHGEVNYKRYESLRGLLVARSVGSTGKL